MYVTYLTINTITILYFFHVNPSLHSHKQQKTPVHSCEMQLSRHIKQQIMEKPDSTVKSECAYSP